MARVIIVGAGMAGLVGALLLAADGHEVTVLERDPDPPPDPPRAAWDGWTRRGVAQARMIHLFLPPFRDVLDAELPAVADALVDAGLLRTNFVDGAPARSPAGTVPATSASPRSPAAVPCSKRPWPGRRRPPGA
jgi:2-polyprenyl-6-methoxyphenol hydroxylase-like FAD-dependent oxidoreductase